MARTVKDTALSTRESRLKLKHGRRYWRGIHPGLALSYRRGARSGSGTWSARIQLKDGRYVLRALGTADDHGPANGNDVLTFAQAQKQALALSDQAKRDEGMITRPVTVGEAAQDYLTWFKQHRKSGRETEHTINAHILPTFENRPIAALTASEIRSWLEKLAATPARLRGSRFSAKRRHKAAPKSADEKRARRATANRILTVFKAILNRAFHEGRVADDSQWRRVSPFEKTDEARIRFLTDAEATRLVNACPKDFRLLIRAALLTGGRYGEITSLTAKDVLPATAQIYIAPSKDSRARHVPLNQEGLRLFRDLAVGKTGNDLLFAHTDGRAWGKNHQVRPLKEACGAGKVRPPVRFHELRHTYASHLAQAGVDLLTISKLLGHTNIRITARYYAHLTDKTLAAAVVKLPSYEPTTQLAVVPTEDKVAGWCP